MAIVRATKFHAGVHVKEEDLLPSDLSCPLCLEEDERKRVLLLQTKPEVYLLRCRRCGGHSASRLPTEETLRRYYGGYYQHLDTTVTCDNPLSFARHVMAYVGPFLKERSISILDFGGGGGDLSQAIAGLALADGSSNAQIDLVDYNSNLSRTESAGITVEPHQTLAEVKGKQFNLVLASAVLEHIAFPRPALIDLLSSVKPGCMFYARTPSMAPILRILQFFRLPYDFTFPAHIHDLGQAFWEQVPQSVEAEVGALRMISSRPSVVETSFSHNAIRTTVAYALKAPWYLLGSRYRLVGGWEVLIQRLSAGQARAA
jgi:2-polyprenyl-3-methyl-5-hydroxy-6-metoxy-1,4-benzoquinol methylase